MTIPAIAVSCPSLANNAQLTFGMQIIYVILLASVKASMLFFFIRVFPTPFMQTASKIALAFLGFWTISYLGACIFLCHPVSAQWTGLGTCGKYIPMIQSLIATNAVADLIIMALPMHSIWSLNTRRSEKLGITACFLLGLAYGFLSLISQESQLTKISSCFICAIFRLIYISTVDMTSDITGTMPSTIFLFILEPNLAILCVSIPMLRPFYRMYKKRMGGSRLEEYSHDRTDAYGSQSRSGQSSKMDTGSCPENVSTWEMDNYSSREHARNDVAISRDGDESGSENNLTTGQHKVGTKWSVSRL